MRQLHLHNLNKTQQHPGSTIQHHLTTKVGMGGEFLEQYLFRDGDVGEMLDAVQSPRILKTHKYYDECGFLSSDNHCKVQSRYNPWNVVL